MSEEITVKRSTYNRILAGLVILAVAFSFTGGYIFGGAGKVTGQAVVQNQAAPQVPDTQQPEEPGRVQVSLDDDPMLGQPDSKVTVVEFSDFECPFCERAYSDAIAGIKKDYVDTGKVNLVFRDFPLNFHPQALPAAIAAECAKEQGKFWEYHNKLFENQAGLGDTNYKQWAVDLGLNAANFNSCYDTKKFESEVQQDYQDGVTAGVSGTPTFFIGSPSKGYVKIVGAQPYASIKAVIEQELAA